MSQQLAPQRIRLDPPIHFLKPQPRDIHHAILCPTTEEEKNHLDCYFCTLMPYECFHKEGSINNLFFDAKRHPEKYPSWLYKQYPFKKIRGLRR